MTSRKAESKASRNASTVLTKGLRVLTAIVSSRRGVLISEIEKLLGLHRSSIYRYLNSLLAFNLIRKDNDERYRAGSALLEMASYALQHFDLRSIAHPHLIDLSEKTNATAHLCQIEGLDVVYLDKVTTSRSLQLHSRIGGRAPLYCTGVGKALLAFANENRAVHIVEQLMLKPFTSNTITEKSRLREELANARKLGYAIDRAEHEEGVWCVAAPVRDYSGEAIAAISVTDSAHKLEGRVEWYFQHVLVEAARISKSLGWCS